MLALALLVSLAQLPPNPAALPPRPPVVFELPIHRRDMPVMKPHEMYRQFLTIHPAERVTSFERLHPVDRSDIVREHVRTIVESHELTAAEREALDALRKAATPSAYAGHSPFRQALMDAELKLRSVASPTVFAAYRGLLPEPPRKPPARSPFELIVR
jgi:hypothetical protein